MLRRAPASECAKIVRLLACIWAVLLLAGAFIGTEAQAQTSKRFALVIGNSKYENTQSLPNAAGDAEEFAAKLKKLGFDVELGIDLTRLDFKNLVSDFRAKIKAAAAEDVVFFYGGHGFSLDGFNHLVPVDAGLKDKDLLAYETLTLDEVIESIRVTKKQNTVVFLDACRNNPLPQDLRGDGVGEGLSELRMSLRGTLVSFATEHGRLTGDGLGDDSPYARALLRYIDTPNQSVNDLLINVRNSVFAETNEKQSPVEQGGLYGSVIFNKGETAVAALQEQPEPEQPETPPAATAPTEEDSMFFEPVTPEAPPQMPEVKAPVPEVSPQDAPPVEAPANAAPVPEMETAGSLKELPLGSTGNEVAPKSDKSESFSTGKSIAEEYVPTKPETSFNVAILQPEEALEPSSRSSAGSLPEGEASRTIDPIVDQGMAASESASATPELPSAGGSPVIEGVEVLPDPEQPADDGGMKFEAPVATEEPAARQAADSVPQQLPGTETSAPAKEEETVVALNTAPEADIAETGVVKGIQEELRRVGCFDGSPDGKWGNKSADALGDYFKQKGRPETGLEPNGALLGELKSDSSAEVCVASVEPSQASEPAKQAGKRAKTTAERKDKPAASRQKPAASKPKAGAEKPKAATAKAKPAATKQKPAAAAKPKPSAPAKKKPVLIIGM